MNPGWWIPAVVERSVHQRTPPVGALIGEQHRIWRVIDTHLTATVEWDENDHAEWERAGCPDPHEWAQAPVRVVVTPEGNDDQPHSVKIGATVRVRLWSIVPEHYAACSRCGEPAPCREYLAAQEAEERVEAAMKAMQLPGGCCPGCRGPITSRQKTYEFAGENLLNPLGEPTVRFHARRKCRPAAEAYEELWVAEDPSRERSLLTLRCKGELEVHADGSAECHNSAEECPSVYARHRFAYACVAQSQGCGRGCSATGHSGTRLASNLAPSGQPRTGR